MSDGSLSQDEIDALLQGTNDMDLGENQGAEGGLTDQEQQAFTNIITGVLDSQASNLSMLIGKTVNLGDPSVNLLGIDGLKGELPDQVVQINIDYSEGVQGGHSYILDPGTATFIASQMMGQEEVELDDAALSAIQEALSQLNGPATTAIGDAVGNTVMTSPPEAAATDKENLNLTEPSVLRFTYPLSIEGGEAMQLVECFALSLVKSTVSQSGAAAQPSQAAAGQTAGGGFPNMQQPQPQQAPPQAQQAFGGPQAQPQQQMNMGAMMGAGPNVQSVQFPSLQQGAEGQEQGNIGLLMDVYMEMTVELGRTKKLIKEILGMGEGTIIELDKLAGEPVDILVNHKLIAKGEVVVIDENFGVRVTEIVSPLERVNNMT